MKKWFLTVLLALTPLYAQIVQVQNAGSNVGVVPSKYFKLNCATGLSCATSGVAITVTLVGGGSGTVNTGTAGHLAYYATSTTAVSNNTNLDDGITTANTLTYAGSGGISALSFTTTGAATPDVYTEQTAPSTPAATKVNAWADSTDHRFHEINSSGTIGTTVVANAGSANNFLTSVSAAGVFSTGLAATGTGTTNTLPKYTTGASAIFGNSLFTDDATTGAYTGTTFQAPTGGCAAIGQKFGSTGTVGLAQGATTAQVGMTNGTNCSILYAIGNTPTFRMASGGLWAFSGTANDATASLDVGVSRIAPNVIGIGSGSQGSTTGQLQAGNRVFVTTDFTDANSAALQAITGLTYTLGSVAIKWSFHCSLMYSQATNVAGDQFGVGVITTAPTSVSAFGTAYTNTGAASPVSTGVLTGLATTTPTAAVTFQPAVATVLGATLDGTIEAAGGGAATFNVYVLNGTAADVIVVKRGSYCELF